MRLTAFVALAALCLASCNREPRSASYFDAHRDEAAKVLASCKAGDTRGAECVNAQVGPAATARDARMAAFHKAF